VCGSSGIAHRSYSVPRRSHSPRPGTLDSRLHRVGADMKQVCGSMGLGLICPRGEPWGRVGSRWPWPPPRSCSRATGQPWREREKEIGARGRGCPLCPGVLVCWGRRVQESWIVRWAVRIDWSWRLGMERDGASDCDRTIPDALAFI
jgi:hypothetical protein